jgi:DNA cross-link repair 1A protein
MLSILCNSVDINLFFLEPKLISDEDESFVVTAFDANHCPGMYTNVHVLFCKSFWFYLCMCFGALLYYVDFYIGAVMLLFEGPFGNVLHTGDSRLTAECLNQLPRHFVRGTEGALDCVYLDCTFGNETTVMPSKEEAIEQVC